MSDKRSAQDSILTDPAGALQIALLVLIVSSVDSVPGLCATTEGLKVCTQLNARATDKSGNGSKVRSGELDEGQMQGQTDGVKAIQKTLDDKTEAIASWFSKYDGIRRAAQMSPAEKVKANKLIDKGFFILLPGFGRISAQRLLKKMVSRYEKASVELEELPEIPETKELQLAYQSYFKNAHSVFKDCRRLISHPFAHSKDGGSLKKSIKKRKEQLDILESQNKLLDARLRDNLHIAP
ncbi:MAG: hypothetical protein K8F91_04130 [Candidatus Obscuribacterales bacterium]|nr:hypothetical protein [Candidatus Obscuribacterales bacterium]